MKIHEYQAKELLRRFAVPVPEGRVARTADQAAAAFQELASPIAVVKAQIHAGGRGKAGGVKLVRSADDARKAAEEMLGKALVTHQTGPQGRVVQTVWIEKGSAIDREFYAGIALDRRLGLPVMMASSEGGMEIEEVAAKHPEKILREAIEPGLGLMAYQARRLAFGIGVPADVVGKAVKLLQSLAKAYLDMDCSIAEVNPLVTTKDGSVLALDAKINFDANALFRHTELLAYRDLINPRAMQGATNAAEKLPDYFTAADEVTPKQHVDIQAASQKWVDSSISKTANVPTDYKYDEFKDIYLYAHEQGLKGCTTFRFNPEAFQGVLVKEEDLKNTKYVFTLEDGTELEVRGDEEIEYDGEIHTAANLFDAMKEGYYGKF